jgi:L-fuculose-phosphate aldolase
MLHWPATSVARLSNDLLICTRHGADKEALTPEDLVVCDLSGRKIEGAGQPTSELNMHRRAYAMRPEVQSVIHAHPPTATALADNFAGLLPHHDAFLLENHGGLTLGRTVRQAALRMDLLEQNARITMMATQLGKPFSLTAADRETLLAFRERMALWGCEGTGHSES